MSAHTDLIRERASADPDDVLPQDSTRSTSVPDSKSDAALGEPDIGPPFFIHIPKEGEFEELLSLARDRNQDAIHDLWVRFNYDFLANNNRGRARV